MNAALQIVGDWIAHIGLELAAEKSEMMMFTARYHHLPPTTLLCGRVLELQQSIKYFGLQLVKNGSF